MLELDFTSNFANELDDGIKYKNRRSAIRYSQHDLESFVKFSRFFYPFKASAFIQDISSRGATFKCVKKLKKGESIRLNLQANDVMSFAIIAVIVHSKKDWTYGVKFKTYHSELAEYLLQTQLNFMFKNPLVNHAANFSLHQFMNQT